MHNSWSIRGQLCWLYRRRFSNFIVADNKSVHVRPLSQFGPTTATSIKVSSNDLYYSTGKEGRYRRLNGSHGNRKICNRGIAAAVWFSLKENKRGFFALGQHWIWTMGGFIAFLNLIADRLVLSERYTTLKRQRNCTIFNPKNIYKKLRHFLKINNILQRVCKIKKFFFYSKSCINNKQFIFTKYTNTCKTITAHASIACRDLH